MQRGRELVGGSRHLPDRRKGVVTLWTGELVFHLCQGCANDIVVMDVRPNRLDGVEPHAMNQIEIARGERRRMCAEMKGICSPAAVMNHESDVERLRLVGLLPCFTKHACLVGDREARRFADVHIGRAKPHHRGDNRVDHVARRHDQESHGTTNPLRYGHDFRQQLPLVFGGSTLGCRVAPDVDVEQPDGHHHDIPIASCLERGYHVGQRMRIANGHEHVARTGLDLIEREVCRAQQVERARFLGDIRGLGVPYAEREPRRESHHQSH